MKSVLTFLLSNVIFSGRDVRQAGIYSRPAYGKRLSSMGHSEYQKGDGDRTGEMKQCPSHALSGPYSAGKGNSLVMEEGVRNTRAGAKAGTAAEAMSLCCATPLVPQLPSAPAAQHP